MQGIKQEIKKFRDLSIEHLYGDLIKELDKTSRAMARAILDILEISEISVTNAKLILHVCEDTLERCTPVNTQNHSNTDD